MGFTHYWQRAPELPAAAFAAAAKDCQAALPQTNIVLAGPRGCGTPVFNADRITFNGNGSQGLETFCIPRRDDQHRRDYCKTNRLPYDMCVQVVLIICVHHFGDAFVVSSDGADGDWDAARQFCIKHLGYGGEFRLARGR